MGTELEWKYAVPESSGLDEILVWQEIQQRMLETPRHYHMQSDYYDTPDLRFSRARITIRRRMENEVSVVCVKAPLSNASDPHLRGEWELEDGDLLHALPRLVALGAPCEILESACLHSLWRADFLRRAVLLRLDDGSTAELALDHGTLSGPASSVPLCELELELKTGKPDVARAFVAAIAAHFGLEIQPLSKFARAKALCDATPGRDAT